MKLRNQVWQDASSYTFAIYKDGDYNGQENCDDKNNESRKDGEDKQE